MVNAQSLMGGSRTRLRSESIQSVKCFTVKTALSEANQRIARRLLVQHDLLEREFSEPISLHRAVQRLSESAYGEAVWDLVEVTTAQRLEHLAEIDAKQALEHIYHTLDQSDASVDTGVWYLIEGYNGHPVLFCVEGVDQGAYGVIGTLQYGRIEASRTGWYINLTAFDEAAQFESRSVLPVSDTYARDAMKRVGMRINALRTSTHALSSRESLTQPVYKVLTN